MPSIKWLWSGPIELKLLWHQIETKYKLDQWTISLLDSFFCLNSSLTGHTALLTEIFSNKLRLSLDNGQDNGLGNEDEINNIFSHICPKNEAKYVIWFIIFSHPNSIYSNLLHIKQVLISSDGMTMEVFVYLHGMMVYLKE